MMILALLALYATGTAAEAVSSWDLKIAPQRRPEPRALDDDERVCPQRCKMCNPGGDRDGSDLVQGVCIAWCSQHNYCGTGKNYIEGGTDCDGCREPTEYQHMWAKPAVNLVVSMINQKYEHTRPYDNDGKVGFKSGSSKKGAELWTFKQEAQNHNEWLIYNAATGKSLECEDGTFYAGLTEPDKLTDYNKWKMVDAGEGWWYIESVATPGAYLAADALDRGFCWKPEQVRLCREDGYYDADGKECGWEDCKYCQHGFRKVGLNDWCCHATDLYKYNSGCSCYTGYSYIDVTVNGKPDKRFKWRFEDLYASSTEWALIWGKANGQTCTAHKTLTTTRGYSSTFTESTATKLGFTFGISASAGQSIEAAKFEEKFEAQITGEVTKSVSSSSTSWSEVTDTEEFYIPGHKCMKYMQIQISQTDGFTQQEMTWGSVITKEVHCNEDHPEFIGAEEEKPCPPDHVIEIHDSAEEDLAEESALADSVLVVEPQDVATDTPLVYGLAVIGFGVMMYGAGRHYMKTESSYDEMTPLEP